MKNGLNKSEQTKLLGFSNDADDEDDSSIIAVGAGGIIPPGLSPAFLGGGSAPMEPAKEGEPPKEVRIKISDVDVIRMAFGPEWNAESCSGGARARLGVIGRGVLQKELPAIFGVPVYVSNHPFSLQFTHPEDFGVRKVRVSIAQVLENDESLHESMVKIEPDKNFPSDAADDLVEEALAEVMAEPTSKLAQSYPDVSFLDFLVKSRQGRLGKQHPGNYTVLPMEAVHLAFWVDQGAETDMVAYKQIGPWNIKWTRSAMIELVLTAPKELWPMAFKHAVSFDPSTALTILKNSLWPEGWSPSRKDVAPLLVCSDSTVRSEAIRIVQGIMQGDELPQGEGAGIGGEIGQKRRVPKKIGY